MSQRLFESTKLGNLSLHNRIVMAPMTRSRADSHGVPGALVALYYAQRASAGLIISEGINISQDAMGSAMTPGLFNSTQVKAWKKVTSAVHDAGGTIFAQLWHTGRVSHSQVRGGVLPVAPSAIKITGQQHFTSAGLQDYEVPRALEIAEVRATILDYQSAAEHAKEAGFDGVELHGAYGYLPNQFLVDGANQRNDEYGGSIENRCRFVLETMQALINVWGPERVGIKLSPVIPFNNMIDSNPEALYIYLLQEMNRLSPAYIHMMHALFPLDDFPHWPKDVLATFGPYIKSKVIANGGYDAGKAEADLVVKRADLISFGNLFIANPDLPAKFKSGAALIEADRATMYGGGAHGYTDYPTHA
jgi:N-ethylmaleimide reductase